MYLTRVTTVTKWRGHCRHTAEDTRRRKYAMRGAFATLVSPSLVLIVFLLSACASGPSRPDTYTVRRGDTLYSIAWRHQLDYHDVARWNAIGRDYLIQPGQVLRLHPPRGSVAKQSSTPATPRSRAPSTVAGAARPPPVAPMGPPVQWQWPVESGTPLLTTRPNGGQGLTISGQLGQEIRAAGDGRVVYTGTGLLGYGQLVIIKHNDTYLSAYGHTQAVSVHEGEAVVAGQRVATMGPGPQGPPILYFEIRTNGAPGNPLLLLPQQ
jgi:lipoprotein NlpD